MRSALSYRAQTPALILLVDDNQDGLSARRAILEELGYRVVAAQSGSDAVECFGKNDFDLLVTDYKMPVMDGLELITWARANGFSKPIILLSGFADTLGLSTKDTGADAIIQKSSNEVAHLIRSAKRLLTAPKKPAGSQAGAKAAQRKRSSSNDA